MADSGMTASASLSVIAPAYNHEELIIPFLESIAAQTWRDYEFIIVDDGSTDGTADLIEAYLPRLGGGARLIRHAHNLGEMRTVVEAFSLASGDVCIKVDSDSVLEPDTFRKIMQVFAADEQVGVVAVLVRALDRSNWILRGTEVLCAAQQRYDQLDVGCTTTAYGTCFAFRRQLYSTEEVASRTDIDLSQLARKRGWRIALRDDTKVQTRFPATLSATFARGRRMAWQELPTHWHHREMLATHWAFWTKFAPFGLILTALLRPRWALVGLLGWLGGALVFLGRQVPDYPLADRLAAWGVVAVRWSGFDLEVLLMAVRAVANKLKPQA